jgi:hypothetical protein
MHIDAKLRGPVEILNVTYDDEEHGGTLLEHLTRLLEAGEYLFIVNLTGRLLDSECMGELIACRERARRHDAVIKLILNERQRDLFFDSKLNCLFEIFREEEDALDSFVALGVTEGIP